MEKEKKVNEMLRQSETMPADDQTFFINGMIYKVVSHYTGNKDADEVIRRLAKKHAYSDLSEQ